MELFGWWKRWKTGDPVCKVADTRSLNRVYNVLEGIEAVGLNGIDAQINKPTDAEGRNWTITIDGAPAQQASKMPFDIVKLANGNYAVYVPNASENIKVNTPNSSAALFTDTPPNSSGYINLGRNVQTVRFYLQVRNVSGNIDYWWGVTTGNAPNAVRNVMILDIGIIRRGEIKQYWHGALRVLDAEPDGRSIERDDDDSNCELELQLLNFRLGETYSGGVWDADYVVRVGDGGSDGKGYRVNYVNGLYIKGEIDAMIADAIAEALADLIDPSTSPGAQLIAYLSGYFQPLVSQSTTTDGSDTGAYNGIAPDANGKTWQPVT